MLPESWGANPPLRIPAGAPLLLCVARLAPQKGVDTSPSGHSRRFPDATLLVLGEGPDRAAWRRLAAELGVGDRVLMPGRVGDIAALSLRCDVVVHPARWEGFGLAMLEAMLAAKPVVAVRAGSAPELVADGETGALVPSDDPAALAAAISTVLANPGGLGTAGLARAKVEFSVERMVARTIGVYDRVKSL